MKPKEFIEASHVVIEVTTCGEAIVNIAAVYSNDTEVATFNSNCSINDLKLFCNFYGIKFDSSRWHAQISLVKDDIDLVNLFTGTKRVIEMFRDFDKFIEFTNPDYFWSSNAKELTHLFDLHSFPIDHQVIDIGNFLEESGVNATFNSNNLNVVPLELAQVETKFLINMFIAANELEKVPTIAKLYNKNKVENVLSSLQ